MNLAMAVTALEQPFQPLKRPQPRGDGDRDKVIRARLLLDEKTQANKAHANRRPTQTAGSGSQEVSETAATTDAERRLQSNRNRNREHARRTRLRKKAHLQALEAKAAALEQERTALQQQLEECSIAHLLLGLSKQQSTTTSSMDVERVLYEDVHASNLDSTTTSHTKSRNGKSSGKRRRFASESDTTSPEPLTLRLEDGQEVHISAGSHMNWKTGVYKERNGTQRQLTEEQLEYLRRERNRRHAKMTRDRKKHFLATIQTTIDQLEADVAVLKERLASSNIVTPVTSPELSPAQEPTLLDTNDDAAYSPVLTTSSNNHDAETQERSSKRIKHGFSLNA